MKQAQEIEMAFVREFATGDRKLGHDVPRSARQEKIRVAILINKRLNADFQGQHGFTYGDAYRMCYGSEVELRGGGGAAAVTETAPDEEDDDDEEAYDDEHGIDE